MKKWTDIFIIILIGILAFELLFVAWKRLIIYENQNIKEIILRETSLIQLQIKSTITENLNPIIRTFDRIRTIHPDELKKNENDFILMLKDHKPIQVLMLKRKVNELIEPLTVSLLSKNETEKLINLCRQLLISDPELRPNNFIVAKKNDIICITKSEKNLLAIINLKILFQDIATATVLKNYQISLTDGNKTHYIGTLPLHRTLIKKWEYTKNFSILGRQWKLTLTPYKSFIKEITSFFPMIFLIIGFFSVIFLLTVARLWRISSYKVTTHPYN